MGDKNVRKKGNDEKNVSTNTRTGARRCFQCWDYALTAGHQL